MFSNGIWWNFRWVTSCNKRAWNEHAVFNTFSYKEEVLIEKCSEQTVEDCKDRLLNFAEQYTYDYLAAAKLLLNYNK